MHDNKKILPEEPLLFYQQFLLGPKFSDHLQSWTQTTIRSNLRLATHPQLTVTQACATERSLTLIGSILDPATPAATDAEVLACLMEQFADFTTLIEATYGYGGRWIILATMGDDAILFHDALGLRQAFYTDVHRFDSLWVMSQPGIVAKQFELSISPSAQEYIDSKEFNTNPQYRWPCAGTPFHEIRQLLPNHYLDLNTGSSKRYWPTRALENTTLANGVERLSLLFPGLVKAAATRFDVALGITAGLDSRMVLAACKDLDGLISGVSVRQATMRDDHRDIKVPARLLEKLGLSHNVITSQKKMTPEFDKVFSRNVFMAHTHYGPDAEAIREHFFHRKAVITGSGAEVGRCRYSEEFRNVNRNDLTPQILLRAVDMGDYSFPVKHFNDWLNNLGNLYNVNVADLFQWEHAHGNWLAMTQLEFALAWQEVITPFNCRTLLTTMLSVPECYRKPPSSELFIALIERLWPELLSEPINPPHRKSILRRLKGRFRTLYSSAEA